MTKLYIARKSDSVKMPFKKHATDAGFDAYIPDDWNGGKPYRLSPHHTVVIPSGIYVAIPENHYLFIVTRSSLAIKNIVIHANIADAGYNGELHFDVHNIGSEDFIVEPGTRIGQLILQEFTPAEIMEVDRNTITELNSSISSRSDGKFGSTGNK